MQIDEILIRYGELSTKGKNIKDFIKTLASNVSQAVADLDRVELTWSRDRMHVKVNNPDQGQEIMDRLQKVFGIQNLSPAIKVGKDLDQVKDQVASLAQDKFQPGMTFKIDTHRADHDYPYNSMELNRILGSAVIQAQPGFKAQMEEPGLRIRVEFRQDAVYLSTDTLPGAKGLPVGTAGKGSLMLSGGIDSPVAGYLSMKRGMTVEAVHFHSPPYTSPQALAKAKDLAGKIAKFGGPVTFIEVPFAHIQEAIKEHIPEGYTMTITRRMMLRLTDRIRQDRGSQAIITGESLGQVASQTLESMQAINAVTTTPVLRPLVAMDKNEIIDLSRVIDTYDLATLPYEDCCTIFAPTKPKTKPKVDNAIRYEQALDIEDLMDQALASLKIETIYPGQLVEDQEKEEFDSIL